MLRPTLDVRLSYDGLDDWTFACLVDTGSPITFFDRGVADALSIRVGNTGAERGQIRVLGGSWPVQFEVVEAQLEAHPETSWSVRAAFVTDPALQMPFQGVLGTEGFLDKFVVTFNKYYDYFMVERPDDWDQRVGHTFEDPATAADPQWERPTKR